MAAAIERLRVSDPVEKIVAALEQDGAVIVHDLLDADTLGRFNVEIDPFLEQVSPDRDFLNPAMKWFFGEETRHITALPGKSPTFAKDVIAHPVYLGVCDAILGPSCARYRLNLGHVLDRGPGAERQFLHRDELVWVHMPRPHPELQVASVVALVDFTAENGATVVAPGSHRWPVEREARDEELVAAVMPAGSAVLYLGSTIHGGGANTTADVRRRAIHISYVLGWLRTEENHFLGTPPDVARKLPRTAQELLGYVTHDAIEAGGGYLGALDLRDPIDVIEGR